MSGQHYLAPSSRGTNPFINAEPIYETGPPIAQTHCNQSSPYDLCVHLILLMPLPKLIEQTPLTSRDNSDAQDSLNPFRNPQMTQTRPIPLAAPRPGYATNISALTLNHPSPVVTPVGPFHGGVFDRGSPTVAVPQTPHPLQPPVTPIAPVFALPKKTSAVKFLPEQPIIRGEKEETLLPKRGEHGDQFWRRFSMTAKVENNKPRSDPLLSLI